MDLVLRQIQQEFKNALTALHSTLPATAVESATAKVLNYQSSFNAEDQFEDGPDSPHGERAHTPGSTANNTARGSHVSGEGSSTDHVKDSARGVPGTARSGRDSPPTGAPAFEDSVGTEETGHSKAQALAHIVTSEDGQTSDMQEIPDLAQAKFATQHFQILKDIVTCTLGTEEVAELAQKRLREEHRVHVDNETGKLMTHREIGNMQNPKSTRNLKMAKSRKVPPSTPGGTALGGSKDANDPDDVARIAAQNQADGAVRGESRGGDGQAGHDEQGEKEHKTANSAPVITYKVSKQSGGTMQADLLPLVQTFGKDQATLWIEWALAKASTMSFGFLGQSSLDPLPDVGFNLKKKPPPGDSHEDELLTQVRNRLLDLEGVLSNPSENSKVTSVRGVRLESRVINFLLLAKVTVQLNMKKEAGQCILQLEEVCAGLRRQQCDSLDSLVYHSFAMRFRMDYEEWCVSQLVSDAWLLSHLVNKLLPLCKTYLNVSRSIGDAVLQRDALKRMINLYSEVSNIAVSEESDILLMSKERIQLLSTPELDAYEGNIEWVQRNGTNRALILFEEMHKLGTNI